MTPEERGQAIFDAGRPKIERAVEMLREAEKSVEDMVQFHKSSMESMDRWLLATLVAINGGAAIAVLNAARDHLPRFRAPLISFTLGVVCAVLAGMMQRDLWDMIVSLRDSTRKIREKVEEYTKIQDYKDFLKKVDSNEIEFKGAKLNVLATLRTWALRVAFYSSLACFMSGAYLAGSTMR